MRARVPVRSHLPPSQRSKRSLIAALSPDSRSSSAAPAALLRHGLATCVPNSALALLRRLLIGCCPHPSAAESCRGTRPIQRTWFCVGTGKACPRDPAPPTPSPARPTSSQQRQEPATRMPDLALAFSWRLRHFLRDHSPRSSVAACGGIAPRPAAPLPLRPCAGTGSSSVHPRSRSPGAASPRKRRPTSA
ncbi:hypothetical protein B0H15DRAFT_249664 [Mycena belliarum]|uniref:Uncharacterized protein n=1 Tax=Mycena belliarum TaxID=1033014 RepID=A0AAD6UA11_9AGAR|nr:hypothetical protein B0H15DRAFT_249664 [Mycena belliae]